MDKLLSLHPVVTPEANEQAEEISKLMQEAASKGQNAIVYTAKPNKILHPLVHHILTSKGYVVDIGNNKTFGYCPNKMYTISILMP